MTQQKIGTRHYSASSVHGAARTGWCEIETKRSLRFSSQHSANLSTQRYCALMSHAQQGGLAIVNSHIHASIH